MPQWTPKLEKLIRKFADGTAKQTKDFINPRKGVASTMLRIAFSDLSTRRAYPAICKEMGLKPDRHIKVYMANMTAIASFARQNGAIDAADKLERAVAVNKKIDGLIDHDAIANGKKPHTSFTKVVKKANITF
jgi:hypothetical protein